MDVTGKRWIGWMWIILGPIILFLSTYSSYYTELVFLIAVAGVGFTGGLLFLRGNILAAKVLVSLSRIVCLYCWVSVLFGVTVYLTSPVESGPEQLAIQGAFAVTNIAIGMIFLLIARGLEAE